MKHATILLIAALGIIMLCSSNINPIKTQNSQFSLLCLYELVYQPDSTNTAIKKEFIKLLITDGQSKFQSQSSRSRDSLLNIVLNNTQNPEIMNQKVKEMYGLPRTNFSYMIFKNPSTNKIKYYDWIGGQLYYYNETPPLFNWKIGSKSSIISGYHCQNATTAFAGRKFEAWFSREVPVSDGPYKFYGLPGLIIKINDSHNYYRFELIKLSRITPAISIELPTQPVRETSKRELERGKIANMASAPDRIAALGTSVSPETKRNIAERIRRQNNPLELK